MSQRLRVHVLAAKDAALALIACEHDTLVSARGFARGGVVLLRVLPRDYRGRSGARGEQQDSKRD
jgi:hypothetical protein